MANASDHYGVVFNKGSATLLARVVDCNGDPIVSTDIESAAYSVIEVDECDPEASTVVAGHDSVELLPSVVVFDTLQTDSAWSVDATGYNFRHELVVATNEAFPKRGRLYQVRYQLTPYVGQRVVFRFSLRSI